MAFLRSENISREVLCGSRVSRLLQRYSASAVDSLCDSLEYLKSSTLCQKTSCCRLMRYRERQGSDQMS